MNFLFIRLYHLIMSSYDCVYSLDATRQSNSYSFPGGTIDGCQ